MLDIEAKNPQMPEDQSEILSSATQDHVNGIALGTFEIIAMHQPVVFHVTDDRLDRITPFQFAPDAICHTPFLTCFENHDILDIVAAVTQINVTAFQSLPA